MATLLSEVSTDRARWIFSLLDILRDSCPNLTISAPDIDPDTWPAFSNMVHSLEMIAMAYDSKIEVGAVEREGEFTPLIVAENDPDLWESITDIALDAKTQAESLRSYHSQQSEHEAEDDFEQSYGGMRM